MLQKIHSNDIFPPITIEQVTLKKCILTFLSDSYTSLLIYGAVGKEFIIVMASSRSVHWYNKRIRHIINSFINTYLSELLDLK